VLRPLSNLSCVVEGKEGVMFIEVKDMRGVYQKGKLIVAKRESRK